MCSFFFFFPWLESEPSLFWWGFHGKPKGKRPIFGVSSEKERTHLCAEPWVWVNSRYPKRVALVMWRTLEIDQRNPPKAGIISLGEPFLSTVLRGDLRHSKLSWKGACETCLNRCLQWENVASCGIQGLTVAQMFLQPLLTEQGNPEPSLPENSGLRHFLALDHFGKHNVWAFLWPTHSIGSEEHSSPGAWEPCKAMWWACCLRPRREFGFSRGENRCGWQGEKGRRFFGLVFRRFFGLRGSLVHKWQATLAGKGLL